MKNISFLAYCDYANVLTEYSNVINKYSTEYKSKVICLTKHPFNYELKHDYDLDVDNNIEAKEWIDNSEHIIFGEEMGVGTYNTLSTFINKLNISIDDKKVSVWHPGSNYRKGAKKFNENKFNNKFHRIIYALDLYPKSLKTDKDIVLLPFKNFDINFETYMDEARVKINNDKKIILHCPSNPSRKGTNLIKRVINNSNLDTDKFTFKYMTSEPNSVIMNAKKNALFYIDQFNDVGSFGVATIESIISGNIVICKIDKAEEGLKKLKSNSKLPIIHSGNNEVLFKEKLNNIINSNNEELEQMLLDNLNYLKEHYYGPNVITYLEKVLLND